MAKPNWPHWASPNMQFWTPEQAISLSLHIDPDQPVPEHLRTSYAERLRELQGAIEAKYDLLRVRNGKVERFDFVFWASQREEWEVPDELGRIAADEPIQEQRERRSARHAAEIHENRYRAVGEYAQRASFDVAELDAWAVANRVPGSFRTLLTPDSVGADLPSVRRFQPCSSLLVLIASAFVPADMEPHEAQAQLLAVGDTGEYPNTVRRLRDLIMGRYERLLLSAVYDGELNLYDTLTLTKIDVTASRLWYEANPGAYVQAAPTRDMDSTQDTDAKVCPEKFSLYWLNTKLDEDAAFAEQALAVLGRISEQRPKVLRDTTTKASAASALVNEWLVNRDLPCYRRGRAIDDFAAEIVEPETSDLSEAIEILEASIELHRDDVVRLLQREGIRVPTYLWRDGALEVNGEPVSTHETVEQRQMRRLVRFRELGGKLDKVGGGGWRLNGRRGALADLSREEKSAGRPRHDASDVRKELEKAVAAENREQIGS
ncbi:hypothetical protein PWP93_04780 [Paraburkholderia sp. A1RI-2L]|uniref:hypothetical protein n=1 Tax=Paraburkholderia sp. A1RI-2L TaxID=3028367 RepID=UPI003B81C176